MKNNVHQKKGTIGNVMEMDGDYSDQEYIDLACLVDPGREIKFVTNQKMGKGEVLVIIDSFILPTRRSLEDYVPGHTHPKLKRNAKRNMSIYKTWLKSYLDYFDPGFYE